MRQSKRFFGIHDTGTGIPRARSEGAVVYDVFAPIRQDYLTPGSGFGAARDEGA